ncbi:MAG: hypothetical protein M1840_006198 [Geoglossum simile]|nr:MAG: hypothetical protein M1840_006198 [Geoglossum simile]
MGYTPPQFGDSPGGDRNTPYSQQRPPQSNVGPQSVTMVYTIAAPAQTVTNPGELRKTTQYVTYATTYVVGPSTVATGTDAALPLHQDAQSGLRGGRLAAAVGFPVASVFALFLVGLFLLKRRRQKRKPKVASGEMANVAGLSPQLPLPKVSDCPPKDDYSMPGHPPIDLERPLPVAFPSEQSENGPGPNRPFTYAGYFSGIDTSAAEPQHVSVNGLSHRSMSPDPPPPYTPPHEFRISPSSASLAHPRPLSAASLLSQVDMPLHGRREIRSPFADPEDDDTESQTPSIDRNEVIRRRGIDDMSIASNISDRDREALVHQMV